MIKLTRLNNQVVAINPDLIMWVEVSPDTTLVLVGGDKIIVREPLDELIARVVEFRRNVRQTDATMMRLGAPEGDPPRSVPPPRISSRFPQVR